VFEKNIVPLSEKKKAKTKEKEAEVDAVIIMEAALRCCGGEECVRVSL